MDDINPLNVAENSRSITPYLSLPATELLDEFGAGKHKPGSGAAAALMVLLSVKLSKTVSSLTCKRLEGRPVVTDCREYIERINEDSSPQLEELFREDCEVFHKVIACRRARDEAKRNDDIPEYRKQSRLAQKHLRRATDIPLSIARLAMEAYAIAVDLFARGFQSARGDSGAAASVALSAAKSSLFICYLNLTSFRESQWSIRKRNEIDELRAQVDAAEERLFGLVDILSREGPNEQLSLNL